MTFIGKLFVMINLAISLLMAVAAFGLYAGGIDWTDRAAQGSQPAGKMLVLRKEIDEVMVQLPIAETSWLSARTTLLNTEDVRRKGRAEFDKEMARATTGKDEVKKLKRGITLEEFLDPKNELTRMEDAEDFAAQKLKTREVYDAQLKDHQAKNIKVREDLEKKVKEDDELTRKLAGDKETDPDPRIRGLRRQLVEERTKREGIVDEQGITESIQVNVAVESELILKRLVALDERIRELTGYLKKKHSVDEPAKWR